MCISFLFFSRNPLSKIKFICLFNREEFISRLSKGLDFHQLEDIENKNLLFFPLDIPTNGTYFCVNVKTGKFSFLLNNPISSDPYNPNKKLKRGALPLDYCLSLNEEKFFENLNSNKCEYNGFNLICGNLKTLNVTYYTNNDFDVELKKIKDDDNYLNINPISNYNKEIVIKKPIQLKEAEVYAFSNNFLYNWDERCQYGGVLLREIILKYDKDFNFLDNNEATKNSEIIEETHRNINKDLFKLMENKDKVRISKSKEEIKNILEKKEDNYIYNPLIEDLLTSSIFLDEKYEDLHIGMGTRNTIVMVFDENKKLKILEYEDLVKDTINDYIIEERKFEKVREYEFNLEDNQN